MSFFFVCVSSASKLLPCLNYVLLSFYLFNIALHTVPANFDVSGLYHVTT